MNFKKFLILFNIFCMIIISGCSSTEAISKNNSPDIVVKGISLKISLIQTAYEMYKVNIDDSYNFDENDYKKSSREDYKHYKWLVSTYDKMDKNMKNKLSNLFISYDAWDYINTTIDLEDDASIDEIVSALKCDNYLNLPHFLKSDLDSFFSYFYDEYFESYIKRKEDIYSKKALELNKKLSKNEVNVIKFVETISGIDFKKDYTSVMYYNFNPFETHSFEYNNLMISTITPTSTVFNVVSLPFYKYSRPLFEYMRNDSDFLKIASKLESDKKLMSMYRDLYKTNYPFEDWCLENLICGFSKYLDYRYYGSTYEYTSYVYDLDFYNYLKDINFNPNKMSLKDASLDFFESIINQKEL
ncbi:MAG: hypothetical protein ACRC3Y_01620 [Romboutsia sp.]|uniref:hypothetical protein n=1 Tax=Romboutsia sp. TaxID=1965302 RepID=UPI003F3AF382